jgi:hypothetical protein
MWPQPVLVLRASALTRAGRVRVARLRAGHAIVDETSSTGQHRIPGRLPLRPRPGWLAAGPAPLHGAPGPVPLRPGQAGLTCTRSACRASTGLPSLPRQTWKPSSPGRQADPFRRPGHADPSAYPRARSPYSDQQPPQRCIAPRPSPLAPHGPGKVLFAASEHGGVLCGHRSDEFRTLRQSQLQAVAVSPVPARH